MTYDVVSFGESMLRLTPPGGTRLEDARSLSVYVAGAESNVLACLSRLGLRCAWISALPATPLGRRITAELQRHGVDTSAVVWQNGDARLGIYYAEESSAPLGVQVYYDRMHSACAVMDPGLVDLGILDRARLLHLTGITPAVGAGATTAFQRLLRRARDRGLPISFDVNYRAKLWSASDAAAGVEEACRAASVLFCRRDDATELWGFSGEPRTIVEQMAEHFGAESQTVVLTLGGEGAVQLCNGSYETAPAFPSDGPVRIGSGDAFAAGYLSAYLGALPYAQLEEDVSPLVFGNAVAALKRCIAGDIASVTPDDVLGLVRQQKGARFR